MPGAPLLSASCARLKVRYLRPHARVTSDDDWARFVICVTATSITGGVKEGQLWTLQIG